MLGDAHWRDTSALIDDACGVKGTHLVIVDEQAPDPPEWLFEKLYYHGEHLEELGLEYANDFFPHDERLPRMLRLPDSHVVCVTDLFTESELKTSPTFNDLLCRASGRNGLNMRMNGPDGLHVLWAIADPVEPSGWRSVQIDMIKRLLPHIRQFVRVRQALAGAEALGATFAELLDNNGVGVLYLDRRGMIVTANDRARTILRRRDGLSDRNGFLRARLAVEDTRLQRMLAHAVKTFGGPAASGSMTIGRSRGLSRLALHVNPVVLNQMDFGARRAAALVLIVDPGSKPRIDPGLVGATLGLTRAESGVAASIAEGSTVRDIAAATHREESSVRWHIKQIYAKLDISRQADLVRMVLSTSEFAPQRD